jgi:hypothetical protein
MHEWQQAAEDTADAEGQQKIDEMTEKQWMEECERHWPPWAAALYLTEQHQFKRGHGRGDVQFSSVS